MRLSSLARGRDNNFNLIRILAASVVLLQHATPTATGKMVEIGRRSIGMSFASIAVDIFFVTSGFLVTGSLMRTRSLRGYFVSRAARIYPALIVVVVLSVFVIGILFTTLPPLTYLTHQQTILYLVRDSVAVFGVSFQLPGVFESNPYRESINASLWTLPYELHMYTILALIWWICSLGPPSERDRNFSKAILIMTALGGVLLLAYNFTSAAPRENGFRMLFFMFFSGATYYQFRDRISVSFPIFAVGGLCLLLATLNRSVFFVVYILTIGYILLFIAYVPRFGLRSYNHVGDYSYGLYIYAFPVEQAFAALLPGITILGMIARALPTSIAAAMLSWHFIEKPALRHWRHRVPPEASKG